MIPEMVSRPAPDHVTVPEAAAMLGVSVSDVRRLISGGRVVAVRVGHAWWIPRDVIEERLALAPRAGRPLSAPNAWAVLFLASGDEAPWLAPQARWLARRRLAHETPWSLRARLSGRAEVRRMRAHPSLLAAAREDPDAMLSGLSAAGPLRLGLVGGSDGLDAYLDAARVDPFIARHHLRRSNEPNVTLRVVDHDAWTWPTRSIAPVAAVGLDLAMDPEPRARQVGERLLASLSLPSAP